MCKAETSHQRLSGTVGVQHSSRQQLLNAARRPEGSLSQCWVQRVLKCVPTCAAYCMLYSSESITNWIGSPGLCSTIWYNKSPNSLSIPCFACKDMQGITALVMLQAARADKRAARAKGGTQACPVMADSVSPGDMQAPCAHRHLAVALLAD